jgi:hypothetical protein
MEVLQDTIEACMRLERCSNRAQSRLQMSRKRGFHRAPIRPQWDYYEAPIVLKRGLMGVLMGLPLDTFEACKRLERCSNKDEWRLQMTLKRGFHVASIRPQWDYYEAPIVLKRGLMGGPNGTSKGHY